MRCLRYLRRWIVVRRTVIRHVGSEAEPSSVSGATLGCLVGTWLLSVVTQGYIIVPASVLSRVASDLAVGRTTAVWLISATPGAWALSNVVVGVVLDRRGATWVTTAATGAFVVAALVGWQVASAGGFGALLATRLVAGVAVGAIWTAAADVVGRTVDTASEGTALGVFTTSAPAGFALGQLATPVVADAYGWPAMFAVVAVLAVVAYLAFLFGVRNAAVRSADSDASIRTDLSAVVRNRAVVAGCLVAFSAYSLYLLLNSWMPTYLQSQFDMSLRLSGLLTALFPAVGVLSRAGGGVVSDRVFSRRRRPVLTVSFAVALPAVALLTLLRDAVQVVLVLVVVGGVVQLTFGVVYSYVRDGVTAARSGTALSFLGTAGISGAFSAPLVAGGLIGLTGGYGIAFAFAAAVAVAGLGLTRLAPPVN